MPTPDSFSGFDVARHALWCHEARARVVRRLGETDFTGDPRTAFIHVNNTGRLDRLGLSAFDENGTWITGDTLYDDDGTGLESASRFDLRTTRRPVPPGSDLEQVGEDGWIIDMDAVRTYDLSADRRETQRTIVLSHLSDMLQDGDARGFLFSADGLLGTEEKSPDSSERP